jgi:biopolymer transport protein ExbD
MAEKRRFLDVWILESNTVYREVPYQVVTDWVQQGRLLEDDKLRPSGTADWYRVGASPELKPYLPRVEPFRAEDQAEALEPVELEFRYKPRHGEEDDDVDMIPLIDVSLVLLIFFMMTATGVAGILVQTPPAAHGNLASNPEEVVLGVKVDEGDLDKPPTFFLALGTNKPEPGDDDLRSVDELLGRLEVFLRDHPGSKYEVSINAHPDAKAGVVRELTARLEYDPFKGRVKQKFIGVSDIE